MNQYSFETSYPKISFGPLVDLGVRIANTLARLRPQALKQRQAG